MGRNRGNRSCGVDSSFEHVYLAVKFHGKDGKSPGFKSPNIQGASVYHALMGHVMQGKHRVVVALKILVMPMPLKSRGNEGSGPVMSVNDVRPPTDDLLQFESRIGEKNEGKQALFGGFRRIYPVILEEGRVTQTGDLREISFDAAGMLVD